MRSFTFRLLSAASLTIGPTLTVQAATFCASTSDELQADLTTAASNGQNNTIDVHLGTYAVPVGGFQYDSITNSHNLDVEGGWYGSTPGQCLAQQLSGANTVLDGQNTDRVMIIETAGTTATITVRYFTFQKGLDTTPALYITGSSMGSIRVENSLFQKNHQTQGPFAHDGIVAIYAVHGPIYFLDNAIVDNVGLSDTEALFLPRDTTDTLAVYVNNNTIAGNITADANPLVGFYPDGNGKFTVSNNIIWDGGTADVYNVSGNAPNMIFANNDIDSFFAIPTQSSNDIKQDPEFIDMVHGNYRLMGNSPARDAGENSPPGTTRNYDLDGNPRVVFNAVDMGAYEVQQEIFANGFGG